MDFWFLKKIKFKKKIKKIVKQKDKKDIAALLDEKVRQNQEIQDKLEEEKRLTEQKERERQEQEKKEKIAYIYEEQKFRELEDRKKLDKN